jgi:hypothetical protein
MRTLFWISIAFIVYVYAGYPLLLAAWARCVRRRPRRSAGLNPQPDRDPVSRPARDHRRVGRLD